LKRPADWIERDRALDPSSSWIVQAPAGSGKTELLTQRMLGLLSRVEHPEEVIAITFTRKAAAEMAHRLIRRLQEATVAPGGELETHEQASRELALAVLANDAKRNWNLLEQPSRLRIRTIDGLCSELARQLPLLSGLGGGQQIAEDPESLYRVAATRTLASIEDRNDPLSADLVRVLDRYDNQYDRLVELITGMLGHREQWIGHLLDIRTGEGFDRAGLEEALHLLIEAELESTRALIPDQLLAELPRFLDYAASNLEDGTGFRALLEACGGPDNAFLDLPVSAEALPHWVNLTGFLLTRSGGWWAAAGAGIGFPAPSGARGDEKEIRKAWKDGYSELLDPLRENHALLARFNTIRKLPRPGYDDEAWESLQSLMRILIRAFQEWQVVMSETGQTDFSEIAARAIEALGRADEPSQLALRMDYRIEHLLVDEFQDTSLSQIRLLERLTAGWTEGDGRTLFLVGDPMQSIYRFRKAEVSLFIEAFNGNLFRHIRLQPLQLRVNFRSTQPVVDWVNRIFPDVMPRYSDPQQDAVAYSDSSARPGAPAHGAVETHLERVRDDREEARRVMAVIENSGPDEQIAILVRSRNHAGEILTLLDRHKEENTRFRYQAIDFNPLAETPLVQDLVSLTLALLQPADRLAWLAVLRSPFCGFDLDDLDELAGGNPESIIPDALTAGQNEAPGNPGALSRSGHQRLQRVAPVLLAASLRRGRTSVRRMVESAWNRLGGPACIRNGGELGDAATYFDLLDELENENLPIDRDTLAQRMRNLYAEPDSQASDRLQVMTIYAAKGLQFDTVILPGLNRGTGNDKGRLLHWFELAGQDRIVMSPMRNAEDKARQKSEGDLIQFIAEVENRRQQLENGRLLYVATTRAIHSLYLFGAVTSRKTGDIKPANGTLLSELWPAIQAEHTRELLADRDESVEITTGMESGDQTPSTPCYPQLYRRLEATWQLPEPADPVPQILTRPAEIQEAIEFRWAGEDARLTGNLVHRLLQMIAEQGIGPWLGGGGLSRSELWCRQSLRRDGVQDDRSAPIVSRVSKAIRSCLDSDRGKWILAPHEEAVCEYALTAVLDHQPTQLVLDRSFVVDGSRWIIDYKTSSHSGGDLEGFLENEADRYREQLHRYREAVAINETRPIRTALYFPLLDRFVEVRDN